MSVKATEEKEAVAMVSGQAVRSRFLNRATRFLVLLVWPLIWVGGLVTTYDAGMSVPDWPGTYGYNLFLYPYKSWFFGPFDLFIEHGHRLLASFVGLVAIVVFVSALRREDRRWVRWLCGGVLAMVIAQGVLGGLRVVLSERVLALIHGCFGQAFFGVCVFAAIATGRWWAATVGSSTNANAAKIPGRLWVGFALVAVCIAYGQVVLGAVLRHGSPTTSPGSFAHHVALHVTGAFTLWLLSLGLAFRGFGAGRRDLAWPGWALAAAVTTQTLLGTGTWVVHYGYPEILSWVPGAESFVVQSKRFVDSIIVTAHVATGALILGLATCLWVRLRVVRAVLLREGQRSQPLGDRLGVDGGPSRRPSPGGQTPALGASEPVQV